MSRKSGNRFSEKDMRQQRHLEHFPIPLNREMLWVPAFAGTSGEKLNRRAAPGMTRVSHLKASATETYKSFTVVPTVVTVPTMTMETPEATSAYSMAVLPRSSRRKWPSKLPVRKV